MSQIGRPGTDILAMPPNERDAQLQAELQRATAELEPLVLASQDTQEEIVAFRESYGEHPGDAPLAPKTLRRVRQDTKRFVELQERLEAMARRYAPLAKLDPDALEAEHIDPALQAEAVGVSVAAAVTLYDNHLSLLTLLADDRIRRLAYDPDRGTGMAEGELEDLVDSLNAPETRDQLRRLVDRWTRIEDAATEAFNQTLTLLRKVIESSVSFRHARAASLDKVLPSKSKSRRAWFLDTLEQLGENALGTVSEIFGNGIGLVEVRKGKLYKDRSAIEHLSSVLQPLDLLLEKTPFRLTDWFIPGHFGHVAIWMGTYDELEALDIWNEPGMPKKGAVANQVNIRAGRCVLEALRPGVELNTLEQFLNVDDVAVLRPIYLTEQQRRESLVRAFQQVGKEYDFNFDVETTNEIVCSELPYHVYPDVPWKTESALGRFTISPDDIASLAFVEPPLFEVEVFYHDGRLIPEAAAARRMKGLMA